MILDELKQYKPYSISPGYNANSIIYGYQTVDSIIPGTTYPIVDHMTKAIEGIVWSDIDEDEVYLYQSSRSLLFQYIHKNTSCYLEYDTLDHRFIIACIEPQYIYRLLLTSIIYIYNHYQRDELYSIYQSWYQLDMNVHLHGQDWDANEYKLVEQIANELVDLLNDIILNQQSFMSLHYDSVEELCQYLHIEFSKENICHTYLFQENKDILLPLQSNQNKYTYQESTFQPFEVQPLFTPQEIKDLPLFLQESIQYNQELYLSNRDYLDRNDFDLIKSFHRGKTWSCLYYGPSGTGKTTKILAVAGALGLPSMKLVGSRSVDESTLFGKYVLRNGETVFEYGPLALMMKYGGMFIFDEINMVDSDVIASLNDVLDGTRQKILDNGEIIHAHPHFRFAESMNIGYTGTNEMNLSHKSRIQNKIKLSKLSIDKMSHIIVKESDLDHSTAYKMASLQDAFQNIIMSEGDETSQRIDLRTLINWANKTVDLDGDVIRASLTTIISDLAQEDDDILNLEDVDQIMSTDGPAASCMSLIVHEFSQESNDI